MPTQAEIELESKVKQRARNMLLCGGHHELGIFDAHKYAVYLAEKRRCTIEEVNESFLAEARRQITGSTSEARR